MSPQARALLDLLNQDCPHRQVYHGQLGGWFVTYGGGQVDVAAVRELVSAGLLVSVYSNCPAESYHVGRTIDVDRTLESRRQLGKRAPLTYVGDALSDAVLPR